MFNLNDHERLNRLKTLEENWGLAIPDGPVSILSSSLGHLLDAYAERDRYLALLKEIATVKDHTERREKFHVHYHCSKESIQRHVRQQLEKWGAVSDD